MLTSVHVLIAVVAIIECLILITFTTFSWIESNSSLVIQNGPESSQVNTNVTKKMDIANQLTSTINLNYTGSDFAPLNNFFSEVKYFEFAKATSSDGRTMFFPCRNNTYSEAGKYRKGDTIDYNTSYLYFDFVMSNKAHTGGPSVIENRDVFFDDAEGYTDIFTVSGDDLNTDQKNALSGAMRMSITTQVGSAAPVTKIFSKQAYSGTTAYNATSHTGSYKSFDAIPADQSYAYDENGGAGHTNNRNTWVTTNALSDSVYHTTNNVIDSQKLFVAKKNADTKVSFRIWFDVMDPTFRSVFDLDAAGFDYSSSTNAYSKIPDAKVGIKFRLKTSGNDLRSIYFDDYTLTNQTGVNIHHLTDENPGYSVWFYAYQPYVAASLDHPERVAGYYKIKLERESSDATHALWTGNTATASEMDYLKNQGGYSNAAGVSNAADRYQKSYFCYGDYDNNNAIYRWELPAAPAVDNEDYVFNAYSYMPNSNYSPASSANGWSDCSKATGTTIRCGVGIWQDDAASSMTLLKFKDMATAVTTTDYNGGSNYQIMNTAATASHAQHQYLVYANNSNSATLAINFTDAVAKMSAAMYYDTSAAVFKSYVPAGWLSGSSPGVSFTYCPGGVFSANGATLRWYDASPQQLNGEYIFTALGYSNRYNTNALTGVGNVSDAYSGSDGFLKGVGTWRDVELIKFSTELIDADIDAAYRYFVGITDSYSQGYYAMIPDESHMIFSAYIPRTQGATAPGVNFIRMNAAKTTASDTTAPAAYWYGNIRGTYGTFHPVKIVSTAASPAVYDRGYWNLSVLVDGTYEGLIYDTLTDGSGASCVPTVSVDPEDSTSDIVDYSPRDNYGLLEYSYDGQNWTTLADDTTDTLNNCIDRYRFYVPAENHTTVYWRWTPYTSYSITFRSSGTTHTGAAGITQFDYTHNVTDAAATGIYMVVTEAPSDIVIATEAPAEPEP